MTDGTKKGGLGALGDDDDLLRELDAWDATFDALHEADSRSGAEDGRAGEADPSAAVDDPTRLGMAAIPADPVLGQADDGGGATLEAEFDPADVVAPGPALGEDSPTVDLDVHTLDRGLPTSRPRPVGPARPVTRTAVADDFDLAAPEALGELLGASPLMPSAAPSAAVDDNAATSVRVRVPTALTGLGANPFDDDVFTSASRPAVAGRDGVRDEDDLAPPPAPVPAAEVRTRRARSSTASGDFASESPTKMTSLDPELVDRSRRAPAPAPAPTPVRTGPAIVRRPDPRADRVTPAGGIPALVEATAVASPTAAQSAASAAAFFAEEPPASEFTLDEAFYDDIEVQAGAAAPSPVAPTRSGPITTPPPSAPEPRRTTVHVVRRATAATRPPPLGPEVEAGPVIEMEADDEPAATGAAPAELNFDDFSDLAQPASQPTSSTATTGPVELVEARRPVVDLDQDSDAAEIQAMPGFEDSTEIGPEGIDDEFAVLGPAGQARPRRPSGNATRAEPLASRSGAGAGSGAVPAAPASAVLSARVKTPTSVPPMGVPLEALLGPAVAAPTSPTLIAAPGPGTDDAVGTVAAAATAAPAPVVPTATVDAARELPDPALDLDALVLPDQGPVGPVETDDAVADRLMIYERELEAVDDTHTAAALRAEAGRLAERLGDPERARGHYEAALIANPRCLPALHGLRRVARAVGDLAEVTTHLDAELSLAGSLERRPLALARVDLLMAGAEQDLARVAVGELLDGAPSDVRGLLAHLELAFLDGRADEFADALDRLAAALPDSPLRASVAVARGHLAEHRGDRPAAAECFQHGVSAGAVAWLGLVRTAPTPHAALLTLAQAAAATPTLAGGLAVRAERHGADPAQRAAALAVASAALPSEPVVATLAARLNGDSNSTDGMAAAFARLAGSDARPALRAHAAVVAAELAGGSAAAWELAAAADPDDEYAAAQRRGALVAEGNAERSLALDVAAVAADPTRARPAVRAALGLAATGDVDAALALLVSAPGGAPARTLGVGDASVEARADILAAAGRWQARAALWAEVAAGADEAALGLALARAARASHDAVIELESGADAGSMIVAALEAWGRVIERDPEDAEAHAACLTLADGLADADVLLDVLGRALAVEREPARARALARARIRAAIAAPATDPARVDELLEELTSLAGGSEDPRRLALAAEWAARTRRPQILAAALGERAEALAGRPGRATEVVAQRYRAAALWLVADEAARAVQLLGQVLEAQPGLAVAHDLATAARRRLGDLDEVAARTAAPASTAGPDAFARLVRDAELAAARGDGAAASVLLGKALTLRPQDPIAEQPLLRIARHGREAAAVAAIALAELRTAEARADQRAVAEAYERLGDVDAELRADLGSAVVSWEAAVTADPHRLAAIRALERAHLAGPSPRWAELARLRRLEAAAQATPAAPADLVALGLDQAGLSERAGLADSELRAVYQAVVEREPGQRVALFHLESLVRRAGASRELAALERAIADLHAADPGASAAFLTRAGETLTEIGDLDGAIAAFKDAVARVPGHVPALAGWRWAALRGQLWVDVAEAALAEAGQQAGPAARARLAHLAAVALMDRALDGDRALAALRVALTAEPAHRDAFVRTRILLEEDANHDDLAALLSQRLDVETDVDQRVALHRAVAELHRNFLSDRDTAKRHYQAILEIDGHDVRAIAAVSDICWEQGAWAEAAEALMARAKLERDPQLLRTLFFRLGLIYAERIPDPGIAIKAFQKALSYNPDDDAALDRLAELAIATGEWKLALGACERLIKIEADPDRRVRHLHRVARVFADGLGDRRRAERALNVALDGAPTNDQALTALIRFYQDVRDVTSVRVHLNRVAGMMRARIAADLRDGAAARVLSRVMVARADAGVAGSAQLARAAAELAVITGGAEDRERSILTSQPTLAPAGLTRPEHTELLYPRAVPTELRQIFAQLGDRLAKHVGVDLRPYGATRGDRLRAKDSPIAATAAQVADGLGVGDLDVYLSPRQPWVMIAEPTSPPSLVIGAELAKLGASAVRFAAGGALVLARASLSIPLRLPPDELAVLVVAMARLFQPDFPSRGAADDAVATQVQKLRRLIPSGLMNDLRPYALALDGGSLEVTGLAAGLRAAAYRAGLVASGSLAAGLAAIAGQAGIDGGPAAALDHPDAADLVQFAVGEDHAALVG